MSKISFDGDLSEKLTVIGLQTDDYIGLLRDILSVFSSYNLNIHEAWVDTEQGRASDTFYVSDSKGGPISQEVLMELKQKLHKQFD